jgi:hypothetical protein
MECQDLTALGSNLLWTEFPWPFGYLRIPMQCIQMTLNALRNTKYNPAGTTDSTIIVIDKVNAG